MNFNITPIYSDLRFQALTESSVGSEMEEVAPIPELDTHQFHTLVSNQIITSDTSNSKEPRL